MVAVVLHLQQSVLPDGRYRVAVSDGVAEGTSDFAFEMTASDREDLRWYLEDYLEYPLDPAPTIAARVEQRMTELGTELFEKIFASQNAREAWAGIRNRLGQVRVEIAADLEGAATLPWELLRDPKTGQHLAVQVESFVRVHRGAAVRPRPPATADRLRLLLVICRPARGADVPFRSVASHLIRLGEGATDVLDVHVLRPPTFEQLTAVLEAADREGRPYHAVHFDGHGAYVDAAELADGAVGGLNSNRFSTPGGAPAGPHGYLLFEDPDHPSNQSLVGGSALGALLARTGVGVLLLNACRSAYTEAPDEPQTGDGDPHGRVRAYGSLALEVAEQGVGGVVAMRYNVYVVTAAQFVADVYSALLAGRPLGSAVTAGRKHLWASPGRVITDEPRPLQDWSVPVVYESSALPVLTGAQGTAIRVSLERTAGADGLPRRPDAGFFGRDETLLALDRAFDRHRIVLLHGYAGSGKTTTAAEFARWYAQTGGLGGGPVVFSSLEHYKPLSSLLSDWGMVFGPLLAANGIEWNAINDDAVRRDLALQVMRQVPALWIWDNVEPVAGFPAGTESAWTAPEQVELADFLRDLAATRGRALLTSRRDERAWLGDTLPRRVRLPAMPMREMIQLTKALAERHGHDIADVSDWRPLLRYTAGNPMTVTIAVNQALRENVTDLRAFVEQLRAGEADLEDDEAEGRTHSLAASLNYGFAKAFTEAELEQLSALQHFRDTVFADVLEAMEIPGLTLESAVALLDRAADLGLLTALGRRCYSIHPALPWFLRRFGRATSTAAYVGAMGYFGHVLQNGGGASEFWLAQVHEGNLLHARALAWAEERWPDLIGCMQGLDLLYDRTGRRREWARLVVELTDVFADSAGRARPGLESEWMVHTGYRAALAESAREFATATRLLQSQLDLIAQRSRDAVGRPDAEHSAADRHALRDLAVLELRIGRVLFLQRDPECRDHCLRAHELLTRLQRRADQTNAAVLLGTTYIDIPDGRDLDRAEFWFRSALEPGDAQDDLHRASVISQLGRLAIERFKIARAENADAATLATHLEEAGHYYRQALGLLPHHAIELRDIVHTQLGNVYSHAGMYAEAIPHYQQSIHYGEASGDAFSAGLSRENVAIALARDGRIGDALLYAQAARRDFQTVGAGAADNLAKVESLIEQLEELERETRA
ncbi:CHAT domain-containing protein [Dactylosporangium sp. NPDC000244]|uniref:CHAT domain-containing protein n=1 Tax=Dactylosporangium sp. NPDC000244 TaxID=3154365 RepID=UPI003322E4AD